MSDAIGVLAVSEDDLFRRLRPLVWAVAVRRMRDPELASDLTQAALEKTLMAVRGDRVRDLDRLGAYALATVRHMVADEVRTRERRRRILERRGPVSQAPPDHDLLDRERLFDCFHALEYRARVVIAATFFEGRSTADIAAQLRVSEGNLRVMRHRALSRLRSCMEEPCP